MAFSGLELCETAGCAEPRLSSRAASPVLTPAGCPRLAAVGTGDAGDQAAAEGRRSAVRARQASMRRTYSAGSMTPPTSSRQAI